MAVPIYDPDSSNEPNGDSDGPHTQHSDSEGIEDYASDTQVEEIPSEDFPNYFLESNDRLFPSNSPYPLPVDAPEQEVCHQFCRSRRLPDKNSPLFSFYSVLRSYIRCSGSSLEHCTLVRFRTS